MVYSKKIVCSFLYPYKDKMPVVGIYALGQGGIETKTIIIPLCTSRTVWSPELILVTDCFNFQIFSGADCMCVQKKCPNNKKKIYMYFDCFSFNPTLP
jgi:hypothetical protein